MNMDDYNIAKAFDVIERELIASMLRNMDRHKAEESDRGIEWTQWQIEQMKALEQYKIRNQKKYESQFRNINSQIESLIKEARESGGMEQEIEILRAIKNGFKGYKKASNAMTAQFFRMNDRKIDALIKATVDDMKKAETAILRMANDKYRQIIFNAQVYANTGAGTYEKAVDMASKDMLAAGLACVEYKNGARHTLRDYADMAIRTASKRAYLTGEGEKRKEWGITTVIMNKRGNPCPKCLPWVGRILIDDVWSGGKKSDGPYPLMSAAVASGLYHPRCRDGHTTYFEGISAPPDSKFTQKEIQDIIQESKKEAHEQYAKRQQEKYGRLAENSLDKENQRQYKLKAENWKGDKNRTEYIENAEKIIVKPSESDIIITKAKELLRKDEDARAGLKFISDETFTNLTISAKKKGAIIIRGTKEAEQHLDRMGAAAANLGDVLIFRKDVCISEVLEETYHFEQNLSKMNDDKGEPLRSILNEIDAKQYLINNADKYKIPRKEIELTKQQLSSYQKTLEEYEKGKR